MTSKADYFQSSLTEKSYKVVAIHEKALNALNASSPLLLATCQPRTPQKCRASCAWLPTSACIFTDGRAMAVTVGQDRARWLNLSSFSQREKTRLLDVPVDPKGLFRPAVATMRKRCKKKGGVSRGKCHLLLPLHCAKSLLKLSVCIHVKKKMFRFRVIFYDTYKCYVSLIQCFSTLSFTSLACFLLKHAVREISLFVMSQRPPIPFPD